MNSTAPKDRLPLLLATLGLLSGVVLAISPWYTGSGAGDDGWRYFPSNLTENSQQANERLSLISRGSTVAEPVMA